MANIFVVFMEAQIDLFLGWSKKEKYAFKYAEKTFQGNECIHVNKMDIEDPSEIFEIPFNMGDEYIKHAEIIKDFGFYLTRIEWEILAKEFEIYKHSLATEYEKLSQMQAILSVSGWNHVKALGNELTTISGEKLFRNFVQHHDFIKKVIDPKDIIERERTKDAFKKSQEMDREYKGICGLSPFDFFSL